MKEIRHGKPATLNWQTLLRRYVGDKITKSYSYAVPPRRFPHLLGIVPGSRRSGGALGRTIDWGELALMEAGGHRGVGLSFFARWSAT